MGTADISGQVTETEKKEEKTQQAAAKKTFPELFAQIRERLEKTGGAALTGHEAYEFHVSDMDGVFYVEIRDGQIDVQPYEYYDHNGVFIASAATYEALCGGSLTPITAYATGRLKISGGTDQVKTLMRLFA